MLGWRCKLGLITPPDNFTIEPELYGRLPEGVTLHSTRLRTIDVGEMRREAMEEATVFGTMGIDVVLYACNLSSFYHGPGSDLEIVDRLEERTDCPVTTASTAMVRALDAVGAERIAVVTPYTAEDNDRLEAFLSGNGVEVTEMSGLGLAADTPAEALQIGQQRPEQTYHRVIASNTADADAVLVTATNLPSAETHLSMERDLGKPVVSANLALLWDGLRLGGVNPRMEGVGTLFSRELPAATYSGP